MVTNRRATRGAERGAAVFIVVLMITLLLTIGLFASRSAALSTITSGYERQMTQTHYLAQYAVLETTAELGTGRCSAYVRQMALTPDPGCPSEPIAPSANAIPNGTCYRFGYSDLQTDLKSPLLLLEPLAPGTPGSLGNGPLIADFQIEMTDLGPSSPPIAGMDLTSAGAASVEYKTVTLTAAGQIYPSPAGVPDLTSASLEISRAHVVVGPLPKL